MRLVTIKFSHYNERARWALDRFGVEYDERGYMPLFHFGGVILSAGLGGGQRDHGSTRFSTPVLITDEGTQLHDSGEIVRFVSEQRSTPETTLYPAEHRAEIEELEQHVCGHLGPHTRRVAYFYVLAQPELLRQMARANVGPAQAWSFIAVSPLIGVALRTVLRIDEARAKASLERVREEMERLGERLGDRPYLVGDRFSAADLTTACMLAPVLLPSPAEGYGAVFPELDAMAPEPLAMVEELRATRMGRFALRMFAQERSSEAAGHPR